jgi:sugar phosphate isomerase/epimerase
LVPQARGGPFVFWDDLPAAVVKAKRFGFDAVEIFPPSAGAIDGDWLRGLLDEHGLKLAAVGTGAGWVTRRWSLTHGDRQQRGQAMTFVRAMVDWAGGLGASAIIGSMQGRHGDGVGRDAAMGYLSDALGDLGEQARQYGVPLLLEPLNRYETNLVNTIEGGVDLLRSASLPNVKLLADLFHMNIEEADLGAAIRSGAGDLGHVHLADSNRWAAGSGHTDFGPVADALRDIGYRGFVSAEVLPLPDPDRAARQTMETFRKLFRPGAT